MSQHSYAIIIPAKNEEQNIGPVLKAVFQAVDGFDADVVVMDDGSTDATADIARRAGARVLPRPQGGGTTIGALRNRGTELARGDILAFIDADVLVPGNCFSLASEIFGQGFSGALGLDLLPPDSAGWVGRIWGLRRHYSSRKSGHTDYLPGNIVIIPRTAFEDVDGFDETLVTAEDKDLTMRLDRAGHKVMLTDRASAIHLGCESGIRELAAKEFWRQSHTLALARSQGFSPRSLRNPLLSLWHLFWVLALAATLAAQAFWSCPPWSFLVPALAWALPSALIALRGRAPSPAFRLGHFILALVRWSVAGAALAAQIARGEPFSNAGRRS